MDIAFPVSDIEVTLPNGELATILDGELDLIVYHEAADPSVGERSYTEAFATAGWVEVMTEDMKRPVHIELRAGHPILADLNNRYSDRMAEEASDAW